MWYNIHTIYAPFKRDIPGGHRAHIAFLCAVCPLGQTRRVGGTSPLSSLPQAQIAHPVS